MGRCAMIRQQFSVDGYWKVIVYYNVNDDFFYLIAEELRKIGYSTKATEKIFKELKRRAKAVTCSNSHYHTSIVLFNFHSSKIDYLNSIVHEAEHIKQAMLSAYHVKDSGEPPAYTIGYLVERMFEVFKCFICP